MLRWERRLKDLGILLNHCAATYFDPELFRMNTNQFLQTSRTVTFLIQKDKASIPDFDNWYKAHVLDPWSSDPRMTWAKNSRNTIEKVGDLEMHSSVFTTLILGYLEDADIRIDAGCEGLIGANIKRLIRFAEKQLPSGVSEGAYVKIERRWVANTLPDWELLSALSYVFGCVRSVCISLATHLGVALDSGVPTARDISMTNEAVRGVQYVALRTREVVNLAGKRLPCDPEFQPPPELTAFIKGRKAKSTWHSFDSLMEYHVGMATINFNSHGNHMPMAFMYGDNWEPIDFISTQFDERSDKYIFWRAVGDRVLQLNPRVVIWVSEAWIREMIKAPVERIDSLRITGEQLHLWGVTRSGNVQGYKWEINRSEADDKPTLGPAERLSAEEEETPPNFFAPVMAAFNKLAPQESD